MGEPVDECIRAMWELCDDDEGVSIETHTDQWWLVAAVCTHGRYWGVSNGQCDLSTAFLSALKDMQLRHLNG